MNNRTFNIIRRIALYIAGLFILALGVSLSVKSGLGVSPLNSVPYALTLVTGMDMGLLVALVFIFFLLLQILILRREFKPVKLLQIVGSFVFGWFVDCTNMIVGAGAVIENYWISLAFIAASIVFVALGILLYMGAGLMPLPGEGLVAAVAQKSGWQFSTVKLAFDCALVIAAGVICFIALGGLGSVREGTVLSAVGIGLVMKPAGRWLNPRLERLLGSGDGDDDEFCGEAVIEPEPFED